MKTFRDPGSRLEGTAEELVPSLEDELQEAADLLSQQEPPVPEAVPAPDDETNPLLIDPAD